MLPCASRASTIIVCSAAFVAILVYVVYDAGVQRGLALGAHAVGRATNTSTSATIKGTSQLPTTVVFGGSRAPAGAAVSVRPSASSHARPSSLVSVSPFAPTYLHSAPIPSSSPGSPFPFVSLPSPSSQSSNSDGVEVGSVPLPSPTSAASSAGKSRASPAAATRSITALLSLPPMRTASRSQSIEPRSPSFTASRSPLPRIPSLSPPTSAAPSLRPTSTPRSQPSCTAAPSASLPALASEAPDDVSSPSKLRTQIVMSDNRGLAATCSGVVRMEDAPYHCLAATINFIYAQRHGYSFTYFSLAWDASEAATIGVKLPPRSPAVGCYHAGTGRFRHSSWCKLLACWMAATRAGASVKRAPPWVMFVDSDAAFHDHSKSIDDFVAAQRSRRSVSGPPLKDALVGFFFNKPWLRGDTAPCAGVFMFHPGTDAAQFFRYWWGAPDHGKSVAHPWEQDSLWSLFDGKEWRSHVAVLAEPTMGMKGPPADAWVSHYTAVHGPVAKDAFVSDGLRSTLHALGIDDAAFRARLREAVRCEVKLDVLRAARLLVAAS